MNKLALSEQQAIMMGIADIIIDTYAMENAILRTQNSGGANASPSANTSSYASSYIDMTRVFCADGIQRIEATMKNTISAIDGGGTVAARQRIAKEFEF